MVTPEGFTRQHIDVLLTTCGWVIQDRQAMNLYAGRGVDVREFPVETGEVEYLLFVDRKAVGVCEYLAYTDFLEERRKKISQVIREGFGRLS